MRIAIVGLLFLMSAAAAHHGAFYEALGKAIEAGDLGSVRSLFRPTVWEEEAAGVDGRDLAAMLSRAEAIDASDTVEYSTGPRCVVAVRFYEKDVDPPRVFWLLGERAGEKQDLRAEAWQVAEVATLVGRARDWLERPLIRSHVEGPPLEAADEEAARPLSHLTGKAAFARRVSLGPSWKAEDAGSPRRFNAEAREAGWRCFARAVERSGDRAVVRTIIWHVEEDQYVETRFTRLVCSSDRWLVHSVMPSKEDAKRFLEGGASRD